VRELGRERKRNGPAWSFWAAGMKREREREGWSWACWAERRKRGREKRKVFFSFCKGLQTNSI
jgi:hypothetical protein